MSTNKRIKIAIVGGGTAGWLTSLIVRKLMGSDASITLIESEEIGILGAGEGTTPSFPGVLSHLDIDFIDFTMNTNATHKLAISFENWNGDGKKYYNPFSSLNDNFEWSHIKDKSVGSEFCGYLFKNNKNLDDAVLSSIMSENNWGPLLKEPIDGKETVSNYAFHFDAHLVAKYLRKIAERRNVRRVEGVVSDFKQDYSGNITKIVLKDGRGVDCDFIFDCSGFARLIIGKFFGTDWKSYKDSLKVNSAIPYFLPQSNTEIKPYTRAIAMKYGWMWQIPLQNRWGCGYIFDDSYINFEDAKKEVEQYLGHSVEFNKPIKFDSGRYEKTWVNNCIAIGLSSGFTEPIEATSIFLQINQLLALDKDLIINSLTDKSISDTFNRLSGQLNDNVKDFLQFHYFTKRKDTPFWETYFESTYKSDELLNKLKKWKKQVPQRDEFKKETFTFENWLNVITGLHYFDDKHFIRAYYDSPYKKDIEALFEKLKEGNQKIDKIKITEIETLNIIKKMYYDKANNIRS